MDNELKAAGITAKKGYEELVYEAVVAIMGEALVGVKTGGMIGRPSERHWCICCCPGCGRDLKMLVVPGLDVVQCCYCSHWSTTPPLSWEQYVEASQSRNREDDEIVEPQQLEEMGEKGAGGKSGSLRGEEHKRVVSEPSESPTAGHTNVPTPDVSKHEDAYRIQPENPHHIKAEDASSLRLSGSPPPSAPPSPPQEGASEGIEALHVCHWNSSGYRAVYQVEGTSASPLWEAL